MMYREDCSLICFNILHITHKTSIIQIVCIYGLQSLKYISFINTNLKKHLNTVRMFECPIGGHLNVSIKTFTYTYIFHLSSIFFFLDFHSNYFSIRLKIGSLLFDPSYSENMCQLLIFLLSMVF